MIEFRAKKDFAAISIIVLLVGAFQYLTLRPGHNWGGDFCLYILQSLKNLDRYEPYSHIEMFYPGHPDWPKQFPPVYPIILTPIVRNWGIDLEKLKLPNILFFQLFLIAFYLLLRSSMNFKMSLWTILLCAFLPSFWDSKESILSDLPFLAFFYVVLACNGYQSERRSLKIRLMLFFLIIVFAILATGTRRIGLVLFPALALQEIIRDRRLLRPGLVITGIFAFVVTIHRPFHQFFEKTISEFASFDTPILDRMFRCFLGFDNAFVISESHVHEIIIFLVIGGLSLAGFILKIRKSISLSDISFVMICFVLAAWPKNHETRYFFPIVPLCLYYTVLGADHLFKKSPRPAIYAFGLILMYAFWIVYPLNYSLLNFREIPHGVHLKDTQEMLRYVEMNTSKDDYFLFGKPQVLALFARRSSARVIISMSDAELTHLIAKKNISHIIVSDDFEADSRITEPFIGRHQDQFIPVFENASFSIYANDNAFADKNLPDSIR